MDALVMCGGRGTRLAADVEKPLFEVGGRPMVDRVLDALDAARVESVVPVVSPHVPETRAHLDRPVIATPGDGYVVDLDRALEAVDLPVLTVSADMPLLEADAVDAVLDAHVDAVDSVLDGHADDEASRGAVSTVVCVPADRKRSLGLSVDGSFERDGRELVAAGINVVGNGEDVIHVTEDARLAVNVNRPADATVAEGLL